MYSSEMCRNQTQEQVLGIPISFSAAYLRSKAPRTCLSNSAAITQFHVSSSTSKSKQDIWNREAKLGMKIAETIKRKLRFGARIVQQGGVEKIYQSLFSVKEKERLLKVSQCYLSTTAGPLAGFLFISTEKIAFCSEKSIRIATPSQGCVRVHYKVSIPLGKTERVNQSMDMKKKSRRYIEVVTVDGFDFWFMGFLNYQKALKCLQQAVSKVLHSVQ